ncbi:hypothetical protein D1871_00405 [Nakamurella silvestris]|nr:hypothetical protein D1871_00405 [Nakamurella silvestris]
MFHIALDEISQEIRVSPGHRPLGMLAFTSHGAQWCAPTAFSDPSHADKASRASRVGDAASTLQYPRGAHRSGADQSTMEVIGA